MSREHQGQKYTPLEKEQVLGVYLGCLNYSKTGRLTGLAPNTVRKIVGDAKKKDPINFAKLCTKTYKKANKYLEALLWETQRAVFDSATLSYMNYPYRLNQFMHVQDKQLIERNKLLYDAKTKAITYEANRIERALYLRNVEKLTKLLKQAEKDTKNYEPLDLEFFSTSAFYGSDNTYELSLQKRNAYIEEITRYLESLGYNLEEEKIDLKKYLADPKEATHYYYASDWTF